VLLPQKEHFGENTNSVTAGRESLYLIELRNSPKHAIKQASWFSYNMQQTLKSLDESSNSHMHSYQIDYTAAENFDSRRVTGINQNARDIRTTRAETFTFIEINRSVYGGEARNIITSSELNNRPNERIDAHLRGRVSHY
jgi:hypothetical protein